MAAANKSMSEHMKEVTGKMTNQSQERLKPWTRADIDRFCKEDPINGHNLQNLRGAAALTGLGGLAGFGSGFAYFFSKPGSFNGKLISGVLGGFSSGMVGFLASTNIACFTHETYKIDAPATHLAFQKWWKNNGGAGGSFGQYW
mmetsp:Transcript_24150/g.37932  ORF Transcript_24150/g.37932 Transcript_24150/m.37932 type:complete len:144 (+) Transcript_24150:1-432(+)